MKLPFYTLIGPALKKYSKFYNRVCAPRMFGYDFFVIFMGILGALASLTDIVRIVQGGSTLSENLWRSRCQRGSEVVSAEVERDMKLMVSILSVEHYILLIFGAITKNPVLLLPWLALEILVIMLEILLFVLKLLTEGIHMNRSQIIVTVIMIHNWLHVFCLFRTFLTSCDY
ncbi:uncharacterized protein [Periplaneta americana]|uniref:uncharacterized protein isoform X3 n=1 Tax=Periplaneta americana TaxID=6978 RepID=UPI0037E93C4E